MFITEELRTKVGASLASLEARAALLESLLRRTDAWESDPAYLYAAERALHVAFECSTDAANDIIDALIMREPGSYPDIIRVLMEEHVVDKDWFSAYEPALSFRDRLVHAYAVIRPEEVRDAVVKFAPLFRPYSDMLKTYLEMR